jgi:hypothetical protein
LEGNSSPPSEVKGTRPSGTIKNFLKNSWFYPLLRTAKNDLLKIQSKTIQLSSVFKSSPPSTLIQEAEADLGMKEKKDVPRQVVSSSVQSVWTVDFPSFHLLESHNSKRETLDARLCFHIPASPNDAFFSQIAMFRLTLNSLGGVYENADIVITLGDNTICPLPDRWKSYLTQNVKLVWVEPTKFLQHSYDAQSDAQWTYDNRDYDLVCFMDADVMLIRPIDELLSNTLKNPAVAGTIAHYAPPVHDGENPQQWWLALAQEFLGKPIQFGYRYTLVEGQPPEYTFCPFYVNFGVVLLTPDLVNLIRETHLDLRPRVARKLPDPYFAAQTSLALTLAALDIPVLPIGMRYNFPNDKIADHLQLNELRDVRAIHYLRTEYFDRQKIFTTKQEFDHFLSLELSGSNKVLQDFVRNLTNGHYPFE